MRKPVRRTSFNSSSDSFPVYAQNLNLMFDYDKLLTMRTASLQPDENNTVILTDPYKPSERLSHEHAWRYDPIVRLAINKKVDFIIGERPVTVLDTIKEFSGNPEAASQAFNNVVGNNEYQEMLNWIDHLSAQLKWHEKLKSATLNMKVYGRSALYIEKLMDVEPIDLKLLNSQKLGQVKVDNDTWKLVSVGYTENIGSIGKDADEFLAEDLIYFPNLNHNVSPDTMWYGYSEIEPIVHTSELNRQIDATVLKETNYKAFAAYGVIKFLEAKDEASMKKWLNNFKPGAWMATDSNIEVELHEMKSLIKEIVEQRNENDLRILRAIGIPSFLGGFEKITNRATVRSILESWKVSTLIPERTMLKNIVEPQWLDTLVNHWLGERNITDIAVKVKQEFKDISFENVKDSVESYLPLFQEGLISGYQFLRLIDLEYLADEAKALQNNMLQQTEQLKTEISSRIDQILGQGIGGEIQTKELGNEIQTKMLKDQLIHDIDAKMKTNIAAAMNEFVTNAAKKKAAKERIDWNLPDEKELELE